MTLRVTFTTDEYDEQPDRLYDTVGQIGGYDVEIEEVEPPPSVGPRSPKPKKDRAR